MQHFKSAVALAPDGPQAAQRPGRRARPRRTPRGGATELHRRHGTGAGQSRPAQQPRPVAGSGRQSPDAIATLRDAADIPGAARRIRQNLALVLTLAGQPEEAAGVIRGDLIGTGPGGQHRLLYGFARPARQRYRRRDHGAQAGRRCPGAGADQAACQSPGACTGVGDRRSTCTRTCGDRGADRAVGAPPPLPVCSSSPRRTPTALGGRRPAKSWIIFRPSSP